MFYHNINPVLLDLSNIGLNLQIRYYGLVYFLGFLTFYFILRYNVKKGKIKNLNLEKTDTFLVYFMIGSILGARILDFVFYNPKIFLTNPLEILRVWNGGMSIHGGIIGAISASYIFSKKYNVKFYTLADIVAIPLMFGLVIGRIANFINGEIPGTKYDGILCVDYTKNQHMYLPWKDCRHPYVLYESLKNFVVGTTLIFEKQILKAYGLLKPGIVFWSSMFLYNALRFFVDFYREETRFLGLSTGQYLCIIFTIISVFFLIKIYSDKKIVLEKKHNEKRK